jgi:hypothetical protein
MSIGSQSNEPCNRTAVARQRLRPDHLAVGRAAVEWLSGGRRLAIGVPPRLTFLLWRFTPCLGLRLFLVRHCFR